MDLHLIVLNEDPFVFLPDQLESDLAEGTENKIACPLITIQRDIGIADGAFQIY